MRQGEHAECGLSALAIAMGFHGVHVTLEDLRKQAGSTLYGSTVRTLRDLARHHGFAASVHRVEPQDMGDLGFPLVAHMRFIHFTVVERVTPGGVHLNDPASGPEIITHERFSRDFTGIAIRLEPGASRSGNPVTALSLYRKALAGVTMQLLLAALLTVISAGLLTFAIFQFTGALEEIISRTAESNQLWFGVLMLALIADWLALRVIADATVSAARSSSRALLAEIPSWSPSVYLLRSLGQSISRVASPLSLTAPNPLASVLAVANLLILVTAAGAFYGGAALFVGCLALLQLVLMLTISLRRGGAIARHGNGSMPQLGFSTDHLAHSDWWRIGMGGENLFMRLAGAHAHHAAGAMRAAQSHLCLDVTLLLIDLLKYAFLVVLLTQAKTNAETAQLIGILALAGLCNLALHRVRGGLFVLPLKDALFHAADGVKSERPDPRANPSETAGMSLQSIAWRPADMFAPALTNVSARVQAGEVLAVSEAAGNAANALKHICAGLLRPTEGRATYNGVPLADLPPGTAILVGRNPCFEAGSLRHNMLLGSLDHADMSLKSALELVDLWNVLAPRGGLDLVLDEQGAALSGGQRYRLALARALVRSPSILVLDGTMDAIEPSLAAEIVTRIRSLPTITVLVSSRAETLALADHQIALEETGE